MRGRLTIQSANEEQVEAIAKNLALQGFQIGKVRSASIAIEGNQSLFESTFQCKLEDDDRQILMSKQPEIPEELGGGDATLYFPRAPEFFP